MKKKALAVLASGRGTNLQAILDAVAAGQLRVDVRVVISDRGDAPALDRARQAGVEAIFVNPRQYSTRRDFDRALIDILQERKIDIIALAGYMRILGPEFVRTFPRRIVNIHPALLPAFPGLEAQTQAWRYGVKIAGCTVHFVDEGVDTGPIILQAAVPVLDDDTPETLADRILVEEHRIFPQAIALLAEDRLQIDGRRVRILPAPPDQG